MRDVVVGGVLAVVGGFLAQLVAAWAQARQWRRQTQRSDVERRQSVVIQFIHHSTDVALHAAGISAILGTKRRVTSEDFGTLQPMSDSVRSLARSRDELDVLEPRLVEASTEVGDVCGAIYQAATRGDTARVEALTRRLYQARQDFIATAASLSLAAARVGQDLSVDGAAPLE